MAGQRPAKGGRADRTRPPVPPGFIDVSETPPPIEYLRKLWRNRDFIVNVPIGKLRAQTFNTALGSLWHLINPLMNAAIYYVVFGLLFNAARAVENYPVFLVVGVFTFMYTSRSVQAGAASVTQNLGLISQIRFPRVSLPLSSIIAEFISHSIALLAMVVMSIVLGESPSILWLLAIPVTVVQTVFNLGLAMISARATFQFRDMQELIPHLMRVWMYFSGLFFPLQFVVDRVGADSVVVTLFRLNPAFAFMHLMRGIIMANQPTELQDVLVVSAWSVALVVVGFFYFRGAEHDYSRA